MDLSNEGIFPSVNDILLLTFENVDAVTSCLGVKSKRVIAKLLEKWKSALIPEEVKLLGEYTEGLIAPNCNDSFPDLYLLTDFKVFTKQSLVFNGA